MARSCARDPRSRSTRGRRCPALEALRVDEEGMHAILEAAFDVGLDTVGDLTDMGSVADRRCSRDRLHAPGRGVDRTVRVYALGELEGQPPGMPDDEYRARLALLGARERPRGARALAPRRFGRSERRVRADRHESLRVGLPGPARPEAARGRMAPRHPPRGHRRGRRGGVPLRRVHRRGLERDAGAAGGDGEPAHAVDERGPTIRIAFRPLLPDETAC